MKEIMYEIIVIRGKERDASNWIDVWIEKENCTKKIDNSIDIHEFEELFGFMPDKGTREVIGISRLKTVDDELKEKSKD